LEALYVYRYRIPNGQTFVAGAEGRVALNRWCLYGCGGVVEASVVAPRIGKAWAEDRCDPVVDADCSDDIADGITAATADDPRPRWYKDE
jgi:hypothetical protein